MSTDVFLAADILVYGIARNDTWTVQAATLLRKGGVISVQVLNEFANVARRKLRRSWPEIADALAALRILFPDPRPIGLATHDAAVDIAARHGFAFYDSLIVASALEAGCSVLLSEHMQDGQVIGGRLTIRDPFRYSSSP
jgi:predicted nucleic acid-binding protein